MVSIILWFPNEFLWKVFRQNNDNEDSKRIIVNEEHLSMLLKIV